MKKNKEVQEEYDFSKGKRGAVIPQQGKTRITIYIDIDILEWFRDEAEREGQGVSDCHEPGITQLYQAGQTANSGHCQGGSMAGTIKVQKGVTILFAPLPYFCNNTFNIHVL